MKKIFVIFLCVLSLAAISQSVPFPPYNYDNQTISSGSQYIYSGNILAPSSSSNADNLSGTSTATLTSTKSITMQPGFLAGSYSSGGYFLGQIGSGSSPIIDAEVYGSSNIGNQFERFEIGLNLNNNGGIFPYNYIDQINEFIGTPKNPGDYIVSPAAGGELDPYDPDQVKIKAVFTNTTTSDQFTRFGFYTEDVTPSVSFSPTNTSSYSIITDGSYPFRVRFAPPETGEWTVQLYLYINDALAPGTQPYVTNFNVSATSMPGYIGIDPDNSQYFAYSTDQTSFPTANTSSLFFPIGQDIAWSLYDDPHLYANYGANSSTLTNHYPDVNDADVGYQNNYINDLAAKQGNFTRLIMSTFNGGIEWGRQESSPSTLPSVICNYRQDFSYELDRTLGTVEATGLYAQILLDCDGYFYNTWGYQWYSYDDIYTYSAIPYLTNPYYYLLGGNNSNPTPSIDLVEFLNQPLAWKYYEKKLFYFMARWGYSPNLAIVELLNEIDNWGGDGANQAIINPVSGCEYFGYNTDSHAFGTIATATQFQTAVSNWVDTMVNYLHKPYFYPQHLTTISYSGIWTGSAMLYNAYNNGAGPDLSPNYVDVLENHDYEGGFDENYPTRFNNPSNSFGSAYNTKPFIFGEMGNDVTVANSTCQSLDYAEDISFHNSEWASAFMSSAAGLYWFDWEESDIVLTPPSFDYSSPTYNTNPIKHRKNFPALATFFADVTPDLEESGWNTTPIYNLLSGAEYFYKSNSTTGEIIGWCQNSFVSWENLPSPPDAPFEPSITFTDCYTTTTPSTTSIFDVRGLTAWTNYYVSIFNTYTGTWYSTATYNSSYGGEVEFTWPFASSADTNAPTLSDDQPDYAFVITLSDGHAPIHNRNSNVVSSPRDTLSIPMDSLALKASPSPNTGQFVTSFVQASTSEVGKQAQITVWNTLGQMVFKTNVVIEDNDLIPIDISNQPSGVYMVVAETSDKILRQKVIVEK